MDKKFTIDFDCLMARLFDGLRYVDHQTIKL